MNKIKNKLIRERNNFMNKVREMIKEAIKKRYSDIRWIIQRNVKDESKWDLVEEEIERFGGDYILNPVVIGTYNSVEEAAKRISLPSKYYGKLKETEKQLESGDAILISILEFDDKSEIWEIDIVCEIKV